MSPTALFSPLYTGYATVAAGGWGEGVPGVGYGWVWAGRAIPVPTPSPSQDPYLVIF